jgi:hypothetical protein
MQPKREFDSNKRKQMKINENKIAFFTYVYFFESGLFNGLHRIQIEFFLALSGTRSGCIGAERTLPSLRGAVGGLSAIEFGIAVDLNQDFGFAQEIAGAVITAGLPRRFRRRRRRESAFPARLSGVI